MSKAAERREIDPLFMPAKLRVARTANRYKKGYLKKSIFAGWGSFYPPTQAQGEREKERRRKQIEAGALTVANRGRQGSATLDVFCWMVIGAAVAYFGVRIIAWLLAE